MWSERPLERDRIFEFTQERRNKGMTRDGFARASQTSDQVVLTARAAFDLHAGWFGPIELAIRIHFDINVLFHDSIGPNDALPNAMHTLADPSESPSAEIQWRAAELGDPGPRGRGADSVVVVGEGGGREGGRESGVG